MFIKYFYDLNELWIILTYISKHIYTYLSIINSNNGLKIKFDIEK